MAEQKQDESFKVIDRRLFTAEGELRKEALEEEKREQESAAARQKPAKSAGASGPVLAGGSPASPGTTQSAASGTAAGPSDAATEAPKASRNFEMLVDFLARNAAVLLGGYADPETGKAIVDLEGGREMIDMLDALREKTRGNLAPEDDRLLLDVLGSLKLSFLEVSKATAQAMKEKAKARP